MMESFVRNIFGLGWDTWATSPAVEANLILASRVIGAGLVLCAIAALVTTPRRTWTRVMLWLGTAVLAVVAFAICRDKMLRVGEFFELGCAISAPLALLLATRSVGGSARLLRWWLTVAVAATFAAHGLYAIGFYPLPGEWVTMVMTLLRLDEPGAVTFLFAAGIFDFLVAAGIIIPGSRVPAALYAVVWGALTAAARLLANVTPENFRETSIYWIPETLVRLPNCLLPLVVLGLLAYSKRYVSSATQRNFCQT